MIAVILAAVLAVASAIIVIVTNAARHAAVEVPPNDDLAQLNAQIEQSRIKAAAREEREARWRELEAEYQRNILPVVRGVAQPWERN